MAAQDQQVDVISATGVQVSIRLEDWAELLIGKA